MVAIPDASNARLVNFIVSIPMWPAFTMRRLMRLRSHFGSAFPRWFAFVSDQMLPWAVGLQPVTAGPAT
jgi:hypothetical protein